MPATSAAIYIHVGAGVLWLLSTLALAATRRAGRWMLASQLGVALIAMLAGIYLWHALHADRNGPTEHLLAVGTFAAFIGFGLQIGVALAAPRAGEAAAGTLATGALVLYRVSVLFLALAAAAMVGSLYA